MTRSSLDSEAVRRLAVRLVGRYLDFALRSKRWTITAPAEAWPYMLGADGRTAIIAFWHEFLPLAPALWLRARDANPALRMTVLISRHRDGKLITDIIRRWTVQTVAGSTGKSGPGGTRDKGGAAAMRQLISLIRGGSLVAITPDGPRGPRRVAQPGVARLAALSGAPVIAFAATTRNGRRIGSWDRMLLPLPFGSGRICCSAPIFVARDGVQSAEQDITAALQAAVRDAGA